MDQKQGRVVLLAMGGRINRASHFAIATLLMVASSLSFAVGPSFIFASQPGKPTFDEGEGGGNPFASALIEALTKDKLTFGEFRDELARLTVIKSRGRQVPDFVDWTAENGRPFLPRPLGEVREALVVVFANYSDSGWAASLPGAQHDLVRVGDQLARLGFNVESVLDPTRTELEARLSDFSRRSAASRVALLYVTGHGLENDHIVYLLERDYPVKKGLAALGERAISLTRLGEALQATEINMVFYAGCRDNPFENP
jgi:hypothetical protein